MLIAGRQCCELKLKDEQAVKYLVSLKAGSTLHKVITAKRKITNS